MVILQITKPVNVVRLAQELIAAGFMQLSYGDPADIVTVFDTDNQAAVQAVYNAHTVTADELEVLTARDVKNAAIVDYNNLAAWARTGTASEAETYINSQVWNGQTIAQVNAWVDANITNISTANVAQINARLDFIRQGLKLAASAIINMRGLFILTAKLLIYIRDLVIRFRT